MNDRYPVAAESLHGRDTVTITPDGEVEPGLSNLHAFEREVWQPTRQVGVDEESTQGRDRPQTENGLDNGDDRARGPGLRGAGFRVEAGVGVRVITGKTREDLGQAVPLEQRGCREGGLGHAV